MTPPWVRHHRLPPWIDVCRVTPWTSPDGSSGFQAGPSRELSRP
ncbi:hypothetical protein SLI_7954 [Streptomyces lividans 1326]|uniref:Uncharacterized protein n=1 Tax=Streptomyces lividans 1326 TaxID=1200984 RepID=A0A7U9E0Q8_STRLI|nr:hypothetical protein SLI_7954 [Streptomyces lividans 1326]